MGWRFKHSGRPSTRWRIMAVLGDHGALTREVDLAKRAPLMTREDPLELARLQLAELERAQPLSSKRERRDQTRHGELETTEQTPQLDVGERPRSDIQLLQVILTVGDDDLRELLAGGEGIEQNDELFPDVFTRGRGSEEGADITEAAHSSSPSSAKMEALASSSS